MRIGSYVSAVGADQKTPNRNGHARPDRDAEHEKPSSAPAQEGGGLARRTSVQELNASSDASEAPARNVRREKADTDDSDRNSDEGDDEPNAQPASGLSARTDPTGHCKQPREGRTSPCHSERPHVPTCLARLSEHLAEQWLALLYHPHMMPDRRTGPERQLCAALSRPRVADAVQRVDERRKVRPVDGEAEPEFVHTEGVAYVA